MMDIDLTCDLNGLKLKNPVFTASGTYGVGEEFKDFYDVNLLGGIVTKTVTLEKREGNLPPRICETRGGIINSIGLQNPGVEAFVKENKEWLESLKTAVIVSVSGRTVDDYVRVCARLKERLRFGGVELNVSCPNERKGGVSFGQDPDAVEEIVARVKKETHLFVITKLSPWTHLVRDVACAAEAAGSNALSATNTIPAIAVDLKTRKSRIGNVTGGLSGPAIKPVSQKIFYDIIKAVEIPVIGVGGIETPEDALEYILLGATAVEVGSANMYNPMAARDILQGIRRYLLSNSMQDLSLLRGCLDEKRDGSE
ncbi:MAG: dihydroorotate dehydrogenase [Candidatus Aureabacteria bacterium]|nr:dihydroorotate dehydrogenase [Candidatus Auribacterota bacterium]